MSTEGLVDERNKVLWDLLNLTRTITIGEHNKSYYEVSHYDPYHIIFVGNGIRSSASFTHELLHIYIRTRDIFIGQHISKHIKDKTNLSEHLSKPLLDHLCNTFEHIIMLPLYLDLGYEKNLFISDYHINKLGKKDVQILIQNFTPKSALWGQAFDYYIGKYFAVVACPNNRYEYNKGLSQMNKIAPGLFAILERFTKRWKEFDHEDKANNPVICELMIGALLFEIESWARTQRTFVHK